MLKLVKRKQKSEKKERMEKERESNITPTREKPFKRSSIGERDEHSLPKKIRRASDHRDPFINCLNKPNSYHKCIVRHSVHSLYIWCFFIWHENQRGMVTVLRYQFWRFLTEMTYMYMNLPTMLEYVCILLDVLRCIKRQRN